MLASTHTPDELRVVLIDMKGGVEFTHWRDLAHLLGEMIETVDGVEPEKRLVQIMKRRFTLLKAVKAKNLEDYNTRVGPKSQFARIVIAIDEMNTFVDWSAHRGNSQFDHVTRLAGARGRSQRDRLYPVP